MPVDTPGNRKAPPAGKPSRHTGQAELKEPEEAERTPYGEAALLYRKVSIWKRKRNFANSYRTAAEIRNPAFSSRRSWRIRGSSMKPTAFAKRPSWRTNAMPICTIRSPPFSKNKKRGRGQGFPEKGALPRPQFCPAHFALANLSLRSGKMADARKHFGHVAEILSGYKPDDIIPESDGITAGRLAEIIGTFRMREMS